MISALSQRQYTAIDNGGAKSNELPETRSALFVAQGFDRIEARGFPGWIEAKDDADGDRYDEGGDDGGNRNLRGPVHDVFDPHRCEAAKGDARQTAKETQDDRFDQELTQDVVRAGTNGHAQADFAGS